MNLMDTIRRWLGQTPHTHDKLEVGESDAVEPDYLGEQADNRAELRLGARPDEFEADQEGPPR